MDLGAPEGGVDGPDPPLGAGSLERERQRAWLPGPGARADALDGPRAARQQLLINILILRIEALEG